MLQTIEIYQESGRRTGYRAIQGQQQAEGKTAGQALDSLEKILTTSGKSTNSLVILQRFQPDTLFPETEQIRLQELMAQFHDAINQDTELSDKDRTQLEQLIDAEWIAAIARTANILAQMNQPPIS